MSQTLGALVDAIKKMPKIEPYSRAPLENAIYVGSGDSLASAYIALRYGHWAVSSGDIEWMEEIVPNKKTMVGISNSGTSGATIRALRRAKSAGMETLAITSSPDSPIAQENDSQLIPPLQVDEVVPIAGHLVLGLGVAATVGLNTEKTKEILLEGLQDADELIQATTKALPDEKPDSISVLSLPELRSGANFCTLKFMEATGTAARDVPLEECGHVDYFIGPDPHLTISIRGRAGAKRFDRLEEAMAHTGQTVLPIKFESIPDNPIDRPETDLARDLLAAIVTTFVAKGAAEKWERPPFRGGAVNMDAAHIKIEI